MCAMKSDKNTFAEFIGPDWYVRIGSTAPATAADMYELEIIYDSGRAAVYTYYSKEDAETAIKAILESADIVVWYEIRRKEAK